MRTKMIVTGLVVLGAMLSTSVASARVDVFVHGRNSGTSDVTDYWHVGAGANNDGVLGFTGANTEGNYTYAYDATASWSNLSADTMPVCALTNAMYNAPGTDMALITHSAGGMSALYMLAVAQNGWANSCSTPPATAKAWATYVVPTAGPFRGAQVADAVYGGTSGNWLQIACGTVAGAISNLLFNQATDMTWALQRSFMANNFASLTAYGTYGSIYQNAGTGTGGDDGTVLGLAASCAGEEGTNDGFVSCNSGMGAPKGSTCGTNGLPGGHVGWYDGVSHSSNRRNDYNTFATHVWNQNPY